MSGHISDPLFIHGGGVGYVGLLVLRHLDPAEGQTAREIALVIGYGTPAVRRALSKLAEIGAVRVDPDRRWCLIAEFDQATVEHDLGLARKAKRRRQRLDAERLQRALLFPPRPSDGLQDVPTASGPTDCKDGPSGSHSASLGASDPPGMSAMPQTLADNP